ncbi:cysteine proteinase [Coprinellus micaceus]|uniref:Cysteine proteinase n=1 Tax=Coprinellus micaceus TaxID=71717 RepID=A0A4Y7SL78_COPMI|nr:cysteine proteinase [Coprinellus micaceus]
MAEEQTTTTERELKDYSVSEMYDMNQRLLNESVPDVVPVSELAPISALREEYENGSQLFLSQIDWLVKQGYTHFRRAKGKYLRKCNPRMHLTTHLLQAMEIAFIDVTVAFAYLDQLIQSPLVEREPKVGMSLSLLSSTREDILNAGAQAIVVDDAYEEFEALIRNVAIPDAQGRLLTERRLLDIFQAKSSETTYVEDASTPPNIVFFLRLATRAQLKINSETYDGFLYDPETGEPLDAESFCNRFVDPVGVEADHMQMTALCRELKLNLDVAYLDGRKADNVDFVQFREGPENQAPLTVLYRPGHYDILVKAESK